MNVRRSSKREVPATMLKILLLGKQLQEIPEWLSTHHRIWCWIFIALDSNLVLDAYRCERAGLTQVKQQGTMAVYGRTLVVHDPNRFERGNALCAWK